MKRTIELGITWTPGHYFIDGNEKAYKLAKTAALSEMIPFIPFHDSKLF